MLSFRLNDGMGASLSSLQQVAWPEDQGKDSCFQSSTASMASTVTSLVATPLASPTRSSRGDGKDCAEYLGSLPQGAKACKPKDGDSYETAERTAAFESKFGLCSWLLNFDIDQEAGSSRAAVPIHTCPSRDWGLDPRSNRRLARLKQRAHLPTAAFQSASSRWGTAVELAGRGISHRQPSADRGAILSRTNGS